MNYRSRIFGSGMFYKNALVIAVPIMLQQLIQSLVSLIDNFMVSGRGSPDSRDSRPGDDTEPVCSKNAWNAA